MANKYSELIGSFIRRGTFPLEADYIFDSYEALCKFYEEPENYAILHKGLLKIVSTDTEQSLYWCVPENGKLVFKELIKAKDIEELKDKVKDLYEKLEQEIKDRKEADAKEEKERKDADEAIWGTKNPEELDKDYNSIKDLINKLKELETKVGDFIKDFEIWKKVINSIVGTEDLKNTELLDYLSKELTWNSLTIINDFLTYFWDEDPDKDYANVKNWSHLDKLFEGLDTSKSVATHLYELWVKIMGDANPDNKYDTLMKIKTHLEDANKKIKQNLDELNAIETAVGLHATGEYKSDPSTKYLKEATSVMDALAILDRLIDEAIKHQNIQVEDTPSLDLTIHHLNDKNVLKGDVKISSEDNNILLIKNDGIWSSVGLTYDKGQVSLWVNGEIRDTFNIGLTNIVKSAKYNPDTESIEIIFKTTDDDQNIIIPVGSLITEWETDNSNGNDVVVLTKTRVEGQGADKLSADVRIYENDFNILVRKERALYVDGRTTNLHHGDVLVSEILDDLIKNKEIHAKDIQDLKLKVEDHEKRITTNTENISELTKTVEEFKSTTNSEIQELKNKDNLQDKEISFIKDQVNKNYTAITDNTKEITKLQQEDIKINNRIDILTNKVDSNKEATDKKIEDIEKNLEDTKKELSDKIDKEIQDREKEAADLKDRLEKLENSELDYVTYSDIISNFT